MDYKYIEQLIDRYLEGQTTLEEEQILRKFFSAQGADAECGAHEELPDHLRQWQPLFCAESKLSEAHLGEEFTDRILALTGEYHVKAQPVPMRVRLRPLFRVAALVAFAIVMGTAIEQSADTTPEPPAAQMAVQEQDELDADEAKPLDIRSAELLDTLKTR